MQKNIDDLARDIVKVVGQWEHLDHKIGAVRAVLRLYSGSLEWFTETDVGEYSPCIPDPASAEAIANAIIDDVSEEPYGARNRATALLTVWAHSIKTPNTDFNLTQPAESQVKS